MTILPPRWHQLPIQQQHTRHRLLTGELRQATVRPWVQDKGHFGAQIRSAKHRNTFGRPGINTSKFFTSHFTHLSLMIWGLINVCGDYRHHIRCHNKKIQCPDVGCPRQFATKSELDRHRNKEKFRYRCPIVGCGGTFSRKDNWRRSHEKKCRMRAQLAGLLPVAWEAEPNCSRSG